MGTVMGWVGVWKPEFSSRDRGRGGSLSAPRNVYGVPFMGQRKEPLPDFFILGAAKCGTASLYNWLAQHSEVCMSKPK